MLVRSYFLLFACLPLLLLTRSTAEEPRHLRVTWTERPDTEATVSWTTTEQGTTHLLRYGAAAGQLDRSAKVRTEATGSDGPWLHHVRLTGLEPAGVVHLSAVSDGAATPVRHFLTAPPDDRPFHLLHGGDSRTGRDARQQVNRMLARLLDEYPDLLALAHGGDYVSSGARWPLWEQWLTDHEATTTEDGRLLPVIPARGNHDGGAHYNRVFGLPPEHRGYFTTRIGSDFALVTLNTSSQPATGAQQAWLEEQLATLRPDHRWLLAQYHRPLYPAYKSPAAAKPAWLPLFERFNLDLALEADGHNMKRTVPIRGERLDETGVTYLGEGGLGVPQRTAKPGHWYLEHDDAFVDKGHHVCLFRVTREEIRYRMLRLEGGEADRHAWKPRTDRMAQYVVEVPAGEELVSGNDNWRYFAGDLPPHWMTPAFDDADWPAGPAGFGYGDDDDATTVDLRNRHTRLCIRREFELASPTDLLHLHIDYDDGFVAWINGHEVARRNVEHEGGGVNVASHEAGVAEVIPLPNLGRLLRPGKNLLAIAGYNSQIGSSDFSLAPRLEIPADPTGE